MFHHCILDSSKDLTDLTELLQQIFPPYAEQMRWWDQKRSLLQD